jgi:hypothetical protein
LVLGLEIRGEFKNLTGSTAIPRGAVMFSRGDSEIAWLRVAARLDEVDEGGLAYFKVYSG